MVTVKIEAAGEVRDADGNLIAPVTAETTLTMTEAEARALIEGTTE